VNTRTLTIQLHTRQDLPDDEERSIDDTLRTTTVLQLLEEGFTSGYEPTWGIVEKDDSSVPAEDVSVGDWFYRDPAGEVGFVQVRVNEKGDLLAQFGDGVYLLEHLVQELGGQGEWRRAELPKGWGHE
jgi:hypothetical protein